MPVVDDRTILYDRAGFAIGSATLLIPQQDTPVEGETSQLTFLSPARRRLPPTSYRAKTSAIDPSSISIANNLPTWATECMASNVGHENE